MIRLMVDINNMRNDYNTLREEMLSVEESHKDIKANLTEEINSVANEFFAVKNRLKPTK